jgi:hypothetical protein
MESQQQIWKVGGVCAAILALISAGAHLFRGVLDRIVYGDWGTAFLLRLVLSTVILCAGWFLFALTILKVNSQRPSGRVDGSSAGPNSPLNLSQWRAASTAALMSLVLALTAWFALAANDEIFFSRSLAWIGPLIWVQSAGFHVASRFFPCRMEGSDLGCEAYKWLPAFLLANAAGYFPYLVMGTLLHMRFKGVRAYSERFLHLLIRWGVTLASAGLATRLLIVRFAPEISLPNHSWDFTRIGWSLADTVAGVLALVLLFIVPLSIWKAVQAMWKRTDAVMNLVDLTWLASFGVIALTIGYQYRS